MRRTVTLDSDVAAILEQVMRERGISFSEAINDAVRRARTMGADATAAMDFPSYEMGEPRLDLDKALTLAGQLEDEEVAQRLATGR